MKKIVITSSRSETLASHADVLRGSSRVPRGAGMRDAPLRMSAGEASETQETRILGNGAEKDHL